MATDRCGIPTRMSFELALKQGSLEEARLTLDELAGAPDTGGLWLPECYADLAQAFDRRGEHDDAYCHDVRRSSLGGVAGRTRVRISLSFTCVPAATARREDLG